MVLSSVDRAMGLGANVSTLVFVVGSLDMESMAKVLFTVVKTGGVKFLLKELSFCLSSVLSFSGPVHRQSLPKSSFSAYPPNSANNLRHGLNTTLISLFINMKW